MNLDGDGRNRVSVLVSAARVGRALRPSFVPESASVFLRAVEGGDQREPTLTGVEVSWEWSDDDVRPDPRDPQT